MSRGIPKLKHNMPACKDGCSGRQKIVGNTWRYCQCTCHKSRSR